MKFIQKFNASFRALSIAQAIGLSLIATIASCSACKPGPGKVANIKAVLPDNTHTLTLAVDKNLIKGTELIKVTFTNTGSTQASPSLFELEPIITEEGGKGTKLQYHSVSKTPAPRYFNKYEKLPDISGKNILPGENTSLSFTVVPGHLVTACKITLNLLDVKNGRKVIGAQTITWSTNQKLEVCVELKNTPGTLKSAIQQAAILTLTNGTNGLIAAEDLQGLVVDYKSHSTGILSLVQGKNDIQGKTLAELGLAQALKGGASKKFDLTLCRDTNTQKNLTIALKNQEQEVSKSNDLVWAVAAPSIALSIINKQLCFKNNTGVELTQAELEKITVEVNLAALHTKVQDSSITFKLVKNNESKEPSDEITNKSLWAILGKTLPKDAQQLLAINLNDGQKSTNRKTNKNIKETPFTITLKINDVKPQVLTVTPSQIKNNQ